MRDIEDKTVTIVPSCDQHVSPIRQLDFLDIVDGRILVPLDSFGDGTVSRVDNRDVTEGRRCNEAVGCSNCREQKFGEAP